jgi:hypothetical protein
MKTQKIQKISIEKPKITNIFPGKNRGTKNPKDFSQKSK